MLVFLAKNILILSIMIALPYGKCLAQKALAADCGQAKQISVMKKYTSPIPPDGPGEVIEYTQEKEKSRFYFRDEHNTAWYKFQIPASGTLGMDIIPENVTDDYDFILYKLEGKNLCENIVNKSVKPVRTCISRSDSSLRGMTGLNDLASENYIHSGPGKSYSRSIEVKKGELYYLVLDNVYENGGRHQIRFSLGIPASISGKIAADSSGKFPKAKASIIDTETGNVVAEIETDPNGEYSLPANLQPNKKYDLIISSQDHFFKTYHIDQEQLRKRGSMYVESKLSGLRVGKSYRLEGINFKPNKPILRKGSLNSVRQLLVFLEAHPNMEIEIEGHTNCAGNYFGPNENDQPLSEARAIKIMDLLLAKGIAESRLQTVGYGCSKMLIPQAQELSEQMINMRVEIKILKM